MKPILEVKGVSKKFKIYHELKPYLSIRDSISGIFAKSNNNEEEFWALKEVSFNVFPGESIGIIGRNGAGKSTLLKILSRITPPTNGKIISRGRIASLLEVGTGFHGELTGRENIFLNGSILGLKKKEIIAQFDNIVDFSGVSKFVDTPIKHYSSGMQLRLAFAVAAHLEPEILIIDEVLAVGDVEFQNKCMGKMNEVAKGGKTVIFVSHNMGAVSQLCEKSIILKDGQLFGEGKSVDIIKEYLTLNLNDTKYYIKEDDKKDIYFSSLKTINKEEVFTSKFSSDESIYISIKIKINNYLKDVIVAIALMDKNKRRIFTVQKPLSEYAKKSETEIELKVKIPGSFLLPGIYSCYYAMHIPFVQFVDVIEESSDFEILDTGTEFSIYGNFDFGNIYSPMEIIQLK